MGKIQNMTEEVYLERCRSYGSETVQEILDNSVRYYFPGRSLRGKRILLKPNLVSLRASRLAITQPEFILACASWFRDQGCHVVLGDSPAFGSCQAVLKRHCLVGKLEDMGVEISNFSNPVQKNLKSGVTLPVCREVLECDLVVNIPRIKAHCQMYVTMALKNIFGIVRGMDKAMLHMVHGKSREKFAEIILSLHDLLPETLHICDGIEVMDKTGPTGGSPLTFGCLAVSCNGVALETALLSSLELCHKNSPLWKVANAQQLPGATVGSINYLKLFPEDFHGSGFCAPEKLIGVRFNPFQYLFSSLKKMKLALFGKG